MERAEILRRHNVVIDQLVISSAGDESTVAVVTTSWSGTEDPAPLDDATRAVSPNAIHWQSVLREVDEDDGYEFWHHLYVRKVIWAPGALDDLLLLVADSLASDVIVAPLNWNWLYHPYDGGADVIARSRQSRDELHDQHSDWLSNHPGGL